MFLICAMCTHVLVVYSTMNVKAGYIAIQKINLRLLNTFWSKAGLKNE